MNKQILKIGDSFFESPFQYDSSITTEFTNINLRKCVLERTREGALFKAFPIEDGLKLIRYHRAANRIGLFKAFPIEDGLKRSQSVNTTVQKQLFKAFPIEDGLKPRYAFIESD